MKHLDRPTTGYTRGMSRRSMLKTGAATGAGLALSSRMGSAVFAQDATAIATASGAAKNIIFMMGDGMGQAHRDFGQLVTVGAYDRLVMDTLPVLGTAGHQLGHRPTLIR